MPGANTHVVPGIGMAKPSHSKRENGDAQLAFTPFAVYACGDITLRKKWLEPSEVLL